MTETRVFPDLQNQEMTEYEPLLEEFYYVEFPTHLGSSQGGSQIAVETSPEDVAGTVTLAIQRVRVTLQNLSLLANKTAEVEAAARKVDACLPAFVGGEWSGIFFGEELLSALTAFETALDAAGPSEVAKRIGAWQVRPASPAIALAS